MKSFTPQVTPQVTLFKNHCKALQTKAFKPHPYLTTPPHLISWRWSGMGVMCVLWVGLVVCGGGLGSGGKE